MQTNTEVTPDFTTKTISSLSNDPVGKIKIELTLGAQADDVVACLKEIECNQSDADFSRFYQALGENIQEIHNQHVETLEKVTHDLRSLTASILGYADLLADAQFRCDENILNSCHQTIIQQGERVNRLMDQAVIMAHLETRNAQIKPCPFSMTTLLEGLISETSEQTERQICFQNQVSEAIIFGDPLYLRIAFLNLIDNGLRYSPTEQPLEVILHPASTSGWIQLDVKDQGIGIDPSQQDILFSRFGRIKNDQNRKSVGSGLGLYLVKKIIQEHNGSVKFKSHPGDGSTFSILLPVDAIT